MHDAEQLLTEREAADFLRLTTRCLQGWRYRRTGPPFMRINRQLIRYRRCDLLSWLDEHRTEPANREQTHGNEGADYISEAAS